MKLHLPKALFTAVIAAFAVSQTAWAGAWDSTYTNTYTITTNETIDSLSTDGQANDDGAFFRAGGDAIEATITTLNHVAGKNLIFAAGYDNTSYDWKNLTIGTLTIGDGTGSCDVKVGTSSADATEKQNVTIQNINGVISNLEVASIGNLTIGQTGDTTSTYTLQGVNVRAGGKLTLAGGVTTMGKTDNQSAQANGEIIVKKDATLKFIDTDVAHWTQSTNITIEGGVLDGGNYRQSFGGSSVINLIGGTIKTSATNDGGYVYGDGKAVIEFASDSCQLKSSGESSITGALCLDWGRHLVVDVLDGALSVDTLVGDGWITKRGDGTLKFTTMSSTDATHVFYKGGTVMEDGAIEYAMDTNGSYNGTISGKGDLVKSGTGTVTLAKIDKLDGTISVSGGTLNVTNLALDKAMSVEVAAGASLNVSTTGVTVDMTKWDPVSLSGTYYVYEGEGDAAVAVETTGNGFRADASTYLLFDGYEWTGSVDGYTTTQSEGDTYLTANGSISSIFWVRSEAFTVDGEDTNVAKTATGYYVEAGQTLTISANQSDTMTAGKILSETRGDGNIKLTTHASMTSAAQAKGKLTIDGGRLDIDTGIGSANSYLSSFSSIDLKAATINYQGGNAEWQSVTVDSGESYLKIYDMGESAGNDVVDMITFKDTTTLTGNLTIQSAFDGKGDSWKFGVNIEALTGTGDLSVISSTTRDPSEICRVNVKLLSTYEGTLSLTHSRSQATGSATQLNITADGDINLEGLNVSGGPRAQVDLSGVTGTKNLGAVNVGANTTLNLQGVIGSMVTSGEGTVVLANGASITGTSTFGGNVKLDGTLSNSGNLTLNGALMADSLSVFDDISGGAPVYTNGDAEGNGYVGATLVIVKSTSDSSELTSAGGFTLSVPGTDTPYELVKNGKDLNLVLSGDSGVYYVNVDQAYAANSKIASENTTGIVMGAATLNLSSALTNKATGFITTSSADGIINVGAGVTLDNASVNASGGTKATLSGGSTAVYDMGAGNAIQGGDANVVFGDAWTGQVVLTNADFSGSKGLRLNSYGGSSIKLVGVNGWFDAWDGTGSTYDADIELQNYADGSTTKSALVASQTSQQNYKFNGKITGSGDFEVATQSTGNYTSTFEFAGDTSEWTGGILVTDPYGNATPDSNLKITVNLTGGGQIFSAEGNNGFVMDRATINGSDRNIVNLNIGSTSADSTMNGAISMGDDERAQLNLTVQGNTTFKKDVEVTSMTVSSEKTATIEAAATTGSLTTNGTVKVTGAGSLTYGGNTKVTAPAQSTFGTETTGATITADSITGGVVTFTGDTYVTENRTISDSSIVNNGALYANVTVGAQNASVNAAMGSISMTAATGSTTVGDLTVGAGHMVGVDGSLTVTDTLTLVSEGAVTVMNGSLTLDGATVDLTGLTLAQEQQSYTLARASSYSYAGVTVDLTEAQLTAAGFAADTQYELTTDADGWLVLALTPNTPAVKPTLTEVNVASGSWDDASKVLTLTTVEKLEDFSGLDTTLNAVIGDELWVQLTQNVGTLVDVSFVDAAGNVFDFDGVDGSTPVNVTLNGVGTNTVPTVYGNEGTVVGSYMTSYIPEPTSTTLSLLALAALAVRRRRK